MKRVFQISEITQLCKDIKSILEQCKDHVSAMRTYADQTGEALEAVPYEARYGIAVHDVSQLRSALKTEQMETALTKLEKCRQRACDLIPAADTDYASQTRELAGVTKSLQTLLEEMEQFLIDTPLTTDYSAFKKAFEEVQARWNKVTENGEKAVEKLMANIKGAEAICHAFSKDPVNLSTGNFIYDRTDLEVGGRESFAFRRFYNAINAHRGVLGKDWNHNYEVHLEFTDGEAVLLREDGKEERFFWEKDRYLSLFASEGALEKGENGYTYRTRDQKTYRFDKEGKCLETESLTGSRITFTYEEEAPFRLVKVQKETGEFFAFFYDTEGMLERVEDHTGRGVAYVRYLYLDKEQLPILCAASREIPGLLRKMLWDREEGMSAILTSGTLKAGAGFLRTRQVTGLEERIGVQEYVAESPFSYEKNCLLYLPKTLEHCRRGSREEVLMVANHIHSLICSTYGHTLVLFTSYTLMGSVYQILRDRLPFPMVEVWRHSQEEILRFKTMENGVLFAAGSCWEGVDFPGDMVSSLIIVKLPFAVPDPISEAEKETYDSLETYIQSIIVPDMQKKLRQGFGRAIRTETDTCVVSILDIRAVKGGKYHEDVMCALPPCRIAEELKEVQDFIRSRKGVEYYL